MLTHDQDSAAALRRAAVCVLFPRSSRRVPHALRALAAFAAFSNLPAGAQFGPQQELTTNTLQAQSLYAVDLDGDGAADLLSASGGDGKLAWYENLGSGGFGPQQIVATDAEGAHTVFASDLDGDGDADVLADSNPSLPDNPRIVWYENLGGGAFGPQQVIASGSSWSKPAWGSSTQTE